VSFKIALEVAGVDLDDEVVLRKIARHLSHLVWQASAGRVTATLYPEADPVEAALATAQQIKDLLPDARVRRVDEDFVGVTDIAGRVGVSREAVRLWVTGQRGPGGFPLPRGTVGGGGSRPAAKFWDWASVDAWLSKHYRLGDGYRYLTSAQLARVNAQLVNPIMIHPAEFAAAFADQFIARLGEVVSRQSAALLAPGTPPATEKDRPTRNGQSVLRIVPGHRGAA
jgi:hypothetical protein